VIGPIFTSGSHHRVNCLEQVEVELAWHQSNGRGNREVAKPSFLEDEIIFHRASALLSLSGNELLVDLEDRFSGRSHPITAPE